MKMETGSWKIWKVTSPQKDGLRWAHITADMLQHGREWPLVIEDAKTGARFSFISNEAMEDWMIGNYSGHAKYLEIRESTGQTTNQDK